MKPLRRIAVLFGLVLALALGQQAGLLHGLAHATERVAQKQDGPPANLPCEQCALAAQLDGVASTARPALPAPGPHVPAFAFTPRDALARAPVVFLARAPPVLH